MIVTRFPATYIRVFCSFSGKLLRLLTRAWGRQVMWQPSVIRTRVTSDAAISFVKNCNELFCGKVMTFAVTLQNENLGEKVAVD